MGSAADPIGGSCCTVPWRALEAGRIGWHRYRCDADLSCLAFWVFPGCRAARKKERKMGGNGFAIKDCSRRRLWSASDPIPPEGKILGILILKRVL